MSPFRWIVLFFLAGALCVLPSCGKKGPPYLPEKTISFRVVNLTAKKMTDHILLQGTFDGFGGSKKASGIVKGSRVYYAEYPIKDPPCDTCPIEFNRYHGFGTEVITEDGFYCKVPGKIRGHIYYFKVVLIGSDDTLAPPSKRVRIVVE